ncbi:hypothetical protein [Spirosoma oryzicola]|uniref:hypothetical protein n=1 Tax=Spirosoma oryzicola TaxID=2898794 RepID=UPI001E2ABA79|nr:hypothetical protein [Spirosoma oryzicola]UHG93313.1 hypothetical protein LQ777_10515 [Spirosoma oryzicola]
MAWVCQQVDTCNKEAESRAARLASIPPTQNAKAQVDEILHWDDRYRRELERRKFLQEQQMLPIEEPVKVWTDRYQVPTSGVELGLQVRNLAKNVSTWKARVGNPKHPDAEAKHAMYDQLYQEARQAVSRERAANQLNS